MTPSALVPGLGPGGLVVPVATFAEPQDSEGVGRRLYCVAGYSGISRCTVVPGDLGDAHSLYPPFCRWEPKEARDPGKGQVAAKWFHLASLLLYIRASPEP